MVKLAAHRIFRGGAALPEREWHGVCGCAEWTRSGREVSEPCAEPREERSGLSLQLLGREIASSVAPPRNEPLLGGVDRTSLYLYDVGSRRIQEVDLASGTETRTIGRDIDGTTATMHVTSDALWAVEVDAKGRRSLARIEKTFGTQSAVVELTDAKFVHALTSDACYVYVAIDGARAIGRAPRRPR